jgi:hypothetical protein
MKKLLYLIPILLQLNAVSQKYSPALQSMIDAENSFAGLSKSTNTRDAFLAYLHDSTVLFNGGKPVTGKVSWENRKADTTLLFWRPSFVGISADGQLGFSVGPWQWSAGRSVAPAAFGYYATVWKKFNGEWKMGVDIGMSLPAKEKEEPVLKASTTSQPVNGGDYPQEQWAFLFTDNWYNDLLNDKSISFSPNQFAKDAQLFRSGIGVCKSPDQIHLISVKGTKYKFIHSGGGISAAQDIGYSYGIVETEVIKDGVTEKKNTCYLRIWKREESKWRIVVELIS